MPTAKPQSKRGSGSKQPNVVDEDDGAPPVLRDRNQGGQDHGGRGRGRSRNWMGELRW